LNLLLGEVKGVNIIGHMSKGFQVLLFWSVLSGFLLLMCNLLMQLELVKFVASYKPLIAGAKVSERTIAIIKHLSLSQMPAQVWL
jgi:hypothetical protein